MTTNRVSRTIPQSQAVVPPNDNAVNSSWGGYRTSIDAIEKSTCFDLLSEVQLGVQAALEAQVDSSPTQ